MASTTKLCRVTSQHSICVTKQLLVIFSGVFYTMFGWLTIVSYKWIYSTYIISRIIRSNSINCYQDLSRLTSPFRDAFLGRLISLTKHRISSFSFQDQWLAKLTRIWHWFEINIHSLVDSEQDLLITEWHVLSEYGIDCWVWSIRNYILSQKVL